MPEFSVLAAYGDSAYEVERCASLADADAWASAAIAANEYRLLVVVASPDPADLADGSVTLDQLFAEADR